MLYSPSFLEEKFSETGLPALWYGEFSNSSVALTTQRFTYINLISKDTCARRKLGGSISAVPLLRGGH